MDADTPGTMLRVTASAASSGHDHRDNGTPCSAGSSHANALTWAMVTASKTRGRPERGRSARPSRPRPANRDRHLRTVSTVIPSRRAITALGCPSAAANTIRARSTSRCSPRTRLARARNTRACPSVSTTGAAAVVMIWLPSS